jgi:hypothetical protein
MRMSDEEVEKVFIRLRWADNKGEPFCPHCGCPTVWACRRPGRAPRWRCKAWQKDFSVTSGALFASLRAYLLAIAIFCNEVKGKSMLSIAVELVEGATIDQLHRLTAGTLDLAFVVFPRAIRSKSLIGCLSAPATMPTRTGLRGSRAPQGASDRTIRCGDSGASVNHEFQPARCQLHARPHSLE